MEISSDIPNLLFGEIKVLFEILGPISKIIFIIMIFLEPISIKTHFKSINQFKIGCSEYINNSTIYLQKENIM